MIDDEIEVRELLAALKEHLPIRAYATPPLVKGFRGEGTKIGVNDPVEISSVLYMGDEGGVSGAIAIKGGKGVVITSLTHVRFDSEHPLAGRIQAYQSRRVNRLGMSTERTTRTARAKLAASLKRKRKAAR